MKTPNFSRPKKSPREALYDFVLRIASLIREPAFIGVTIFGNILLLASAVAFFYLENGTNPAVKNYFDAIWWAASTVTTVGYGDVVPMTDAGKALGLVTMLLGTAVFLSYTALFAAAIVSNDIGEIESEVRGVEKRLSQILQAVHPYDPQEVNKLVSQLEESLKNLKSDQSKKS